MTTTVSGLLCWRDFHPLEWQLASLHWSGRALQEGFVELVVGGLASMYPAFDLELDRLLAIMENSAPCELFSGQASAGHSGHQGSQAPGRPDLHLVSSSRRPRQVVGSSDYLIACSFLVAAQTG
jgi:hypothetical protein